MEISNEQTFRQKTQLLDLNEHCLMEIFQRLELLDFVNLSLTCRHLQDVSNVVGVVKFKKISVYAFRALKQFSKQKFSNVMSVIGEHVLEVKIHSKDHILEIVRYNCKKLNSVKLLYSAQPVHLSGFCNLKELQVRTTTSNYDISNDEWRKILANNVNLEILHYNSNNYEQGFVELLATLPKLKSLGLPRLPHHFQQLQDFEQLLRLGGLSKLKLFSHYCNEILIEVADKLKLLELDICMKFNYDLLEIIKSFRGLEVLSMELWLPTKDNWLSDATVFPPSLKHIKVENLKISCSNFMSIVEHLKLLEEFDLCIYGDIFLDQDKLIHLKDSMVISQIEDELRRSRRTLKIIHRNWELRGSLYTHKSNHLTIVNSLFTADQANLRMIYVA